MNADNEPSVSTAREPIRDAADFEKHLADIEALLQRGIELVRQEKYDEFMELGPAMGEMLNDVTRAEAPITHVAFEAIGRMKKLHHELGLILASQHEEMAKKLAQMKTGKSVHKAYKNALG
ncbi:MAG: hypothetical protein JW849_01695 [Phycisphaerae bacterium]|nr:hypothetical protein [Phycisphaerae bacterium]